MNLIARAVRALRSPFHRPAAERALADELRFHIEQQTAANLAAGMAPDEARRRALLEFGGAEAIKEECREQRSLHVVEVTLRDLRFGLRLLRKNPGFAAVAILVLALGIGANTAIFSAVNAVLLHPLPFPRSDRVVHIREATPRDYGWTMSLPDFEDYNAAQKAFAELALWQSQSVNYAGADHPDRVIGSFVSANFFQMLGVGAGLGRTFAAEDEKPGAAGVAVLAFDAWQGRFGSDPNILGRKLMLNGEAYEVVGVLPRSFAMPWFDSDVWMTIQHYPNYRRDRAQAVGLAFGRLRDGVAPAAAAADLNTVAQRLAREYPQASAAGMHIELTTVQDMINVNYKPMLLLLFAGVGTVLLIACANVANLLLARGAARQREMAVRMAIGCSRWRILRQLLTESVLLALLAGTAALLVGSWIMRVLVDLVPGGLPFYSGELDAQVIAFTLGLSLVTGVLFGITPGWQLSRASLQSALGSGARTSGGQHAWSARSLFVVTQIALSVGLLFSAVLLVRSLRAMLQEDIGFNAGHLLTAEYRLPRTKYVTAASRWAFHEALLAKLRQIPGAQAAAIAQAGPFSGNGGRAAFLPPHASASQKAELPVMSVNVITPDYFATLGIPLLRGRTFADSDAAANTSRLFFIRAKRRDFWHARRAHGG